MTRTITPKFKYASLFFLLTLAASLVACSGGGGKGPDAGAGAGLKGPSMVPDGSLTSNEPPSPDLVGIWTLAARISDGTCAGRRPVRGEVFAQEINLVIDAAGCKIFSQDDAGTDLSIYQQNGIPMVLFDPAMVTCKAAGNQLVISQQDVPQNAPNTCSISTTMVISLQLGADPDTPLKGVSGWNLDVSPGCPDQLKPDSSCRGNVIEFFAATTEGYKGRRLSVVAPPPPPDDGAGAAPEVPTEVSWSERKKTIQLVGNTATVRNPQVAYPSVSGDPMVVWTQVYNDHVTLKAAVYDRVNKRVGATRELASTLLPNDIANQALRIAFINSLFSNISLAMNETGSALVSWVQVELGDNPSSHVKRVTYNSATKTWSAVSPAADNAKAKSVVVKYDSPTTALLVWSEAVPNVPNHVVLKSQRFRNNGWAAAEPVVPSIPLSSGFKLEARAAETLLLWGEILNLQPQVVLKSRKYDSATNRWAAAEEVSPHEGAIFAFDFKYDAAGNGMVVWSQGNEVRAKTRTADGEWGEQVTLDANSPNASPVLSVAPNGNAMAVWGKENYLSAAKYDGTTGEWATSDALNIVGNEPAKPKYKPLLVTDAANNFTLVWVQQSQQCSAGENNTTDCTMLNPLYSRTYVESEGTWQSENLVASDSSPDPVLQHFSDPDAAFRPDAPQPVLAVDGQGANGLLAWTHYDGMVTNIFLSSFTGLVPAAAPAPVP